MLDLLGGFHAGPLFVVNKKRPPVRPLKKAGIIHRRQTQRATPKWLTDEDRAGIRAAYREARQRTLLTGELHVVDHIVPKISPLVCGLHVPWKRAEIDVEALGVHNSHTYCNSGIGNWQFTTAGLKLLARDILACAAVCQPAEAAKLIGLLRECSATLKMWADVAPAVSLVKDTDAFLATGESNA